MESPTIVTGIIRVAFDRLDPGHPYIPTVPRPYHSLGIITEGRMRYTCGGETIEQSRGEVLYIKAGSLDRAETATDGPVKYYTVDFVTLNNDFHMDRRYRPDEDALLPQCRHLEEVFTGRGSDWMTECIGILYTILLGVRRGGDDAGRTAYPYRRVAPAMELIRDRLDDPTLSVAALADACGITTVSLNRCFHRLYDMPVSQYLLYRRMEKAKELLLNAANTVGDVAKAVGFGDIYAFSHAFTRQVGRSPQHWRSRPDH